MRLSRIILLFISAYFIGCSTNSIRSTTIDNDTKYDSINGNDIPLRNKPKLSGKIKSYLTQDEKVKVLSKGNALTADSEFAWVYIATEDGKGWISGENIVIPNGGDNPHYPRIEDAFILKGAERIKIGMPRNFIIDILGVPYSEESNNQEYIQKYIYDDGNLVITSHINRIVHIAIKSPQYELQNGLCIGQNISSYKDRFFERFDENKYVFFLINKCRSSSYDSVIEIETNSEGIITEIKVAHTK